MKHSKLPVETDLLAAMQMRLPQASSVLVFAPHPDDEVFGAGGIQALFAGEGCRVQPIIVTDGALGGDPADETLVAMRKAESTAAAAILGVSPPIFWGEPDRSLCYGETLIQRIADTIRDFDADLVILPSLLELHPDHQALALSGIEALRRLGTDVLAVFYEINAPLPTPNLLIDISPVMPRKQQAMAVFASQLKEQPYDVRMTGLNQYRSYFMGANATAAEAFFSIAASAMDAALPFLFEGALSQRRRLGFPVTQDDLPLVSVMIRSMDRPTLDEALRSVALQTYANCEVVVINAMGEGHRTLGDSCGRFPLRQVNPGKPLKRAEAANACLDHARGELLIFLDDDDYFLPHHIHRLVQRLADDSGAVAAYAAVRGVDEKGTETRLFAQAFDPVELYIDNFIPIHSILFRRFTLDVGVRFDCRLDFCEDWDFWLQLSRHGKFLFEPEIGAVYRISSQHSSGVWNNPVSTIKATRFIYGKHVAQMDGDTLWIFMDFARRKRRVDALENRLRQSGFSGASLAELIDALQAAYHTASGKLREQAQTIEDGLRHAKAQEETIAAQLVQLEAQAAQLEAQVQQSEAQQQSQQTRIDGQENQIQALNSGIVAKNHEIQAILASSSWKCTAPLRWIKQCCSGKAPHAAPSRGKSLLSVPGVLFSAMRNGKGLKTIFSGAWRVYRSEGIEGVFRVLSMKQENSARDAEQALAQNAGNAANEINPSLPKIDFDSTINRFVGYQANPPINPAVKVIAFYLPQFHPFPENDAWWGKGFTEWTNVGKAKPNYADHYQPHCPIHNGYYDLRVPEVMEEQAKLAREYGIHGFNYYFYWFDGKTLMERPLEMMLANKKVDMPFCLTWANENWTRRWDGQENDILIAQKHSHEDSLKFIRHIMKYFRDRRYICIEGKPVLIVYRASIITDMAETTKIWQEEVIKNGFTGLYLIAAQTFGIRSPKPYGFDASLEFPPHTIVSSNITNRLDIDNKSFVGNIYSYDEVVENAIVSKEPEYKLFRTAMLSWDNTARKQNNGHIFHDFSLLRYKQWLSFVCNKTYHSKKYSNDEKIVFVNAWNEWAEGTHLEPDQKFGYGYLQTTYDVIADYDGTLPGENDRPPPYQNGHEIAVIVHLHYGEVWPEIRDYLHKSFDGTGFDLYVTATSGKLARAVQDEFAAAQVMLVENRGRDVLPFIYMLNCIKDRNYLAVCKIHSKRSIYRNDGDQIRNEIFSSLIGTEQQVNSLLSLFRETLGIGMIVPKKYLMSHTDHNMTYNHEKVRELTDLMNIEFNYDVFPAGSMFWFAPQSLTPLLAIDSSRFEIESGLSDGTTAHAIERLFCAVVKHQGYTVHAC